MLENVQVLHLTHRCSAIYALSSLAMTQENELLKELKSWRLV